MYLKQLPMLLLVIKQSADAALEFDSRYGPTREETLTITMTDRERGKVVLFPELFTITPYCSC